MILPLAILIEYRSYKGLTHLALRIIPLPHILIEYRSYKGLTQ